MTEAEITELAQLEREAWPAPWVARTFEIDCPCPNGSHCGNTHTCEEIESPEAYPSSPEEPAEPGEGQCVVQIDVPGLESLAGPNAKFIAAARNALPGLLAELKHTRTLVAERDAALARVKGLRAVLTEIAKRPPDCPPDCDCNATRARAALARADSLRAVHDKTHVALAKAGPEIHDLANLDHARAVEALIARVERAERWRDEALKTAQAWANRIPEVTRLAHDRALASEAREAALRAKVEALAKEIREALPEDLRAAGWMVAVHNDYRLNGEPHTFWLLTHADGRYVKGEGHTDAEALNAIRALLAPAGEASPPPGETQEAAYPTPWAYEAACKALETWRARARILQAALLACCRERCPACPGKEGSHDDRCWLGTVLEGTPGPAYDATCAAILEKAK